MAPSKKRSRSKSKSGRRKRKTTEWNRYFARYRKQGMDPKAIGKMWRSEGHGKAKSRSKSHKRKAGSKRRCY